MAYTLGPVKPHVKAAADEVGSRFDVSRIYGFGARANNYSDHPLGLALDYVASGAKGDAIANYVQTNSARLGVKYIIWEQRIWYPPNGPWKLMEDRGSVSANHFDHVHVSFKATPGTDGPIIDQAGFSNPLDQLTGFLDAMKGISAAFTWITNSQNWIRIAGVTVGAILIMIAIVSWDKVSTTARNAASSAVSQTSKMVKTNAS